MKSAGEIWDGDAALARPAGAAHPGFVRRRCDIMRSVVLINIIALLILSVGCGIRDGSSRITGRVIRSGLYETPGKPTRIPIDAAPTGHGRLLSQAPVFVKEATRIPATLGVRFGFDFEVTGLPPEPVELRAVTIYPPIHKPDGSVANRHEFRYPPVTPEDGRVATSFGFGFDKDYELVSGKWTLQIWRGDKKLVERDFEIYRP